MDARYSALVLALGLGCEMPRPAEEAAREPDSLVFTMKTKERTFEDCIAGAEGCTYIRFDYPVITDVPRGFAADVVTATIQSFLESPLRDDAEVTTVSALMDGFIDEFRALKQREPSDANSWFLERKAFVLESSPAIVSLSFSARSYLGGAHGIETIHFANIDPRSGNSVTLADLFVDGYQSRLQALAEARFREVRQIEEGTSLKDAGFTFDGDSFALTDNFAVGRKGLTFYYNPYEIASYALGPTEMVLRYEELEDLLKPELEMP